ncbi:hypothetical protein PFISCL1PPCAC_25019, partial [Pristionchus fissidentatus]
MTPMSAGKPPVTCLELAQEGERACRDNNFVKGIDYLQKALSVGTDDTTMLSAIYSQLGNAYFSIRAYVKALEYHRNDLLLTRFTNDQMGELKASANVGHTYKAIAAFPDAILYTKHQLNLASKLPEGKEKMACEARALYNLATIYQMKSRNAQKSVCLSSPPSMGGLIDESFGSATVTPAAVTPTTTTARTQSSTNSATPAAAAAADSCSSVEEQQNGYLTDLQLAIDNYKASLDLSERLPDTLACGRTYGCLGNAYYMLREFKTAIDYHYKRLETARQFGDKGAMRRAYTSLANAHVFLPDMQRAMEFYRLALQLAVEMNDALSEAQACFSLGNAASLVADHRTALEYHHKHLLIARALDDRAGEARAYSSLAGDLRALHDYPKAVYFLALRRRMAREMHDDNMVATTNEQLRAVIKEAGEDTVVDEQGEVLIDASLLPEADDPPVRLSRSLRSLHSSLDADCGLSRQMLSASDGELASTREDKDMNNEDFFAMLERMQGKRLDDQRCDPVVLSDLTNQRSRQTDQLMLSPSVSVSSVASRRRFSTFLARIPSATSKKFRKTTSSLRLVKGGEKEKEKRGGGGGEAKGGEEREEEGGGGFKTPSLSSIRSVSPSGGRAATMNGGGAIRQTPLSSNHPLAAHGRRAESTSGLDQSIMTISEDGSGPTVPSPSHSSSTGSRSFVNLPAGFFKVPRFPSRRSNTAKKLASSVSLPEGGGVGEQRRHSLYARPTEAHGTNGPEAIMDMIMSMQGRRMEEQRATLLPGLSDQRILEKLRDEPRSAMEGSAEIDDHLYELVINAQKGRIEDQRSELGGRRASESVAQDAARRPMTIPEDDISELVARMQAGRMDEQRAVLPPSPKAATAATA